MALRPHAAKYTSETSPKGPHSLHECAEFAAAIFPVPQRFRRRTVGEFPPEIMNLCFNTFACIAAVQRFVNVRLE